MVDIEQLLAETLLEGAEWHSSAESTNSLTLELAPDASCKAPYLVGAGEQTAGRGRGTNRWWAADGTLMFSVLFDMPSLGIPQSDWPRFSLGTALSVAETIEAFAPQVPVGLKWPNDVWIGARKTCGILIEQSHLAPQRLVVGIGLNVNTLFGDAPEELREIATSLAAESGQRFSLQEVLVRLLQRWELNIVAQRNGDWDLRRLWSRLCVLSGHRVRVSSASGDILGQCHGIADDGSLLVEESGQARRCYAGTVRLLD